MKTMGMRHDSAVIDFLGILLEYGYLSTFLKFL